MQVFIYVHPEGKVWAINDIGTAVVFGGVGKGMQQRSVNHHDWAVAASKKVSEGYFPIGGLVISGRADFLEVVLAFRTLHYIGGDNLALCQWDQNLVRDVCEQFSGKSESRCPSTTATILAARRWLLMHPTTSNNPIIPMPSITLTSGRGCYF